MSAENALGTVGALLKEGMTQCSPRAPSITALSISMASARDTVAFPTVIVNSFSPWPLATSLLLAEPLCQHH